MGGQLRNMLKINQHLSSMLFIRAVAREQAPVVYMFLWGLHVHVCALVQSPVSREQDALNQTVKQQQPLLTVKRGCCYRSLQPA